MSRGDKATVVPKNVEVKAFLIGKTMDQPMYLNTYVHEERKLDKLAGVVARDYSGMMKRLQCGNYFIRLERTDTKEAWNTSLAEYF